jgi:hypothetical protein
LTKAEVAKLLALASSVDNRIVREPQVEAWHAIIGRVEFDDAVEALWEHFRKSKDYLMPAHVYDGARIARERRERRARVERQAITESPADYPFDREKLELETAKAREYYRSKNEESS